jgi:hypothetical protein
LTPDDILFQVVTPLGFRVRTSQQYWNFLVTEKHETLRGREDAVAEALGDPSEVRRSRSDPNVFLFYRVERPGRWLCVVTKRLNGEGFIITAYPTDAIKEGETVWRKQRK